MKIYSKKSYSKKRCNKDNPYCQSVCCICRYRNFKNAYCLKNTLSNLVEKLIVRKIIV